MKIDENMKQNYLSEVNIILEVLQSVVSKSFLSSSKSQSPEEIHLAAGIFPVISCFASVIKFVNEGSVSIPQDTVKQFLEVAKILEIVNEENVHHEDNHEEEVGDEDFFEEEVGDDDFDNDLWWDDSGMQQHYQLYWGGDDDVFTSDEDEEDLSIAHRVKVRRGRLGAAWAGDWVPAPPATCTTPRRSWTPSATSPTSRSTSTPAVSSPEVSKKRRNIGNDPFISSVLRTIRRTSPKAIYNTYRAEILRKERVEEKIANIVPEELRTLWDTLEDEDDNNTPVPDPYPTLDWSKVNKRFIQNIPTPTLLPVHGCSADPTFYEWSQRKGNGSTIVEVPSKFEQRSYYLKKGLANAAGGHVFGGIYGYETSEGNISVSSIAHHGYIWDNGSWILHAQLPKNKGRENKLEYKKITKKKKKV